MPGDLIDHIDSRVVINPINQEKWKDADDFMDVLTL